MNGLFEFQRISNIKMKILYAWINIFVIIFWGNTFANISLHRKLAYWNRDIYPNSLDSFSIKLFHKLKHWNLSQSWYWIWFLSNTHIHISKYLVNTNISESFEATIIWESLFVSYNTDHRANGLLIKLSAFLVIDTYSLEMNIDII